MPITTMSSNASISLPECLSKPSNIARFFSRFPFYGLNNRKRREICIQIRKRTRANTKQYWPSPELETIAGELAKVIQSYFNWPNTHFLPDDPMEFLLFEPGDGLLAAGVLLKIEEEYTIPPEILDRIGSMTFGDFVSKVHKH